MGIDLGYGKSNERWRYVCMAMYDSNTSTDISIGRVSTHSNDILDKGTEVLSCSGRHPTANRSMQPKECDDVMLIRFDLSSDTYFVDFFCQVSDLLLR